LSERDYARKIVLKNKASKDTLVHEIMARDVIKPTDNLLLYGIDEYKTDLPVLENNGFKYFDRRCSNPS
jgi:hypothetical protein